MTRRCRLIAVAAVAASLPATAVAEPPVCTGGKTMQTAKLGRNIAATQVVSATARHAFVARELTPHFPGGLTITDAVGQRRDPRRRKLAREPSKVVEIVLPGDDDDTAKLDAVVAAYKHRFHRQSVGIVTRQACVQF